MKVGRRKGEKSNSISSSDMLEEKNRWEEEFASSTRRSALSSPAAFFLLFWNLFGWPAVDLHTFLFSLLSSSFLIPNSTGNWLLPLESLLLSFSSSHLTLPSPLLPSLHFSFLMSASPPISSPAAAVVDPRETAIQAYRRKFLEHRELEARTKKSTKHKQIVHLHMTLLHSCKHPSYLLLIGYYSILSLSLSHTHAHTPCLSLSLCMRVCVSVFFVFPFVSPFWYSCCCERIR